MPSPDAPGRRITFVKKVLANGQPCAKCADVEQRLRAAGQMAAIHRTVIADERDPDSEGMRIAAEHNVKLAPFFVVEERGETRIYTIYFRFAREVLGSGGAAKPKREAEEILRANPDLDLV
ncbi:MAG: hypothetical protein F4Y01_15980 [Gammaproteobacteria bacterium]|nr:hypothetical protein [Gammaproteobacteria bacterium]